MGDGSAYVGVQGHKFHNLRGVSCDAAGDESTRICWSY